MCNRSDTLNEDNENLCIERAQTEAESPNFNHVSKFYRASHPYG